MLKNKSTKSFIINFGKDSFFYIPSMVIPSVFSFIALFLYTRAFSPQEYGDYSLIMVTIGIIGIITYSWINNSILRFYIPYKNHNKLEYFFSTLFFSLISMLALSLALLLVLSKYSIFPDSIKNYLLLITILIISISFLEITMTILRSERKPIWVSFFRSLSSCCSLTFSLFFIYILNLRISSLFLSLIFTNAILILIVSLKFKYYRFISLKHFSVDSFKEFFIYGAPLITTLLFQWILLLSDRYMITLFRNPIEVGIYSAVYQLIDYPLAAISSLIITAAFPIIVEIWEKKGDIITQDYIPKIVRYHIILTIPILFGLVQLSENVMSILGPEFIKGISIIPWIAVGSFAIGLTSYYENGMELRKKTKYMALIMAVAGIENIVLNLVVVPHYGFYGAGISTSVSNITYLALVRSVSKKIMPWDFPIKTVINCIIASLFMCIALSLIKYLIFIQTPILSLLIQFVFGVIIYLMSIYVIGEIREEISFIKSRVLVQKFTRRNS